MNEKMLLLEQSLRRDLETIDQLFATLSVIELDDSTDEATCIVVGYRLHNLYNAFENVFRNVARTFENSLDERAGWHIELLRRMRLDLLPIRPALIDDAAFDRLDELRRFRHLFRALYSEKLDPTRLSLALAKARELQAIWPSQVAAFLAFVRSLD
jgi:hypothetical protein